MARPIFNAGMFGVPTGLDMTGLKTPEMTPTIAAAASPRRRRGLSGMLGGVVNLANGVIDQDRQPNFLDFLLGGQNRVDAMRAAPYEQDALQFRRDQQAHQRQAWAEGDATQQRLREWAATQGPDAQVDPASSYEAWRAANAPLTRDQRADDEFRRAQLEEMIRHNRASEGADWVRANARSDAPVQLRGADRQLMQDIQEADARTQGLTALDQQFLEANGRLGTGSWSNGNPLAGLTRMGNPDASTMTSTSSQMRTYMRPPGSGATSDFEQRLYAMGVPSIDNTGPQNQAIAQAHQTLATINRARRFFYEDYAQQNGSLLGAEQAFQRSPEFQQVVRQNPLPGATAPQAAPQAPTPQSQTGGVTRAQPTRAELEAERDRRLRARGVTAPYNNQPGGYSGR